MVLGIVSGQNIYQKCTCKFVIRPRAGHFNQLHNTKLLLRIQLYFVDKIQQAKHIILCYYQYIKLYNKCGGGNG